MAISVNNKYYRIILSKCHKDGTKLEIAYVCYDSKDDRLIEKKITSKIHTYISKIKSKLEEFNKLQNKFTKSDIESDAFKSTCLEYQELEKFLDILENIQNYSEKSDFLSIDFSKIRYLFENKKEIDLLLKYKPFSEVGICMISPYFGEDKIDYKSIYREFKKHIVGGEIEDV